MQFIQLIALLIVSLTVNGETPLPNCPYRCSAKRADATTCRHPTCSGKYIGYMCFEKCMHGYVDEGLLCRKKSSIVTYAKHKGHVSWTTLHCRQVEHNF